MYKPSGNPVSFRSIVLPWSKLRKVLAKDGKEELTTDEINSVNIKRSEFIARHKVASDFASVAGSDSDSSVRCESGATSMRLLAAEAHSQDCLALLRSTLLPHPHPHPVRVVLFSLSNIIVNVSQR